MVSGSQGLPYWTQNSFEIHFITTLGETHTHTHTTRTYIKDHAPDLILYLLLFFQVINGLMEREDWQEAIQTPLGILPGGSGNALAASVHHYSQ